jgi:DNA-binding NarL/FixJ family response regulator
MAKTRILVVDEHPLLRYGIIAFIEGQPDMIACGEADSVPERAEQALGNQAAPDGYRVTIGGWRQLGTS